MSKSEMTATILAAKERAGLSGEAIAFPGGRGDAVLHAEAAGFGDAS